MRRKTWYSLHKWFALAAGLALLVWLLTGIVLSAPDLIRFPELRSVGVDPTFESLVISPAEAVQVAREGGLEGETSNVVLRRVGPYTAYHVLSTAGDARLVDAALGVVVTVDSTLAEEIVRLQFGLTGELIERTLIDEPNGGYPYGPLPAFQMRFSDEPSDAFTVAQSSGEVLAVSPVGRLRILAGNLHSFEQLDRWLPPWGVDAVLILFSLVMLVASAIGFWIAFPLWRRRRTVE